MTGADRTGADRTGRTSGTSHGTGHVARAGSTSGAGRLGDPWSGAGRRRGRLVPSRPRRPGSPRHAELSEPSVYPLVDFRPDALDQAFGHSLVITRTEVLVGGHGSTDLRRVVAAHERTLQRGEDRHK
jgi:hypothetical protein